MNTPDNIEAIYPLSPMQQGMLFHSLYTPESGVYFEQLCFTLHGDLDVAAFERAWQHLIDRHPALRTVFAWETRDKPLQVVRRHATLPWTTHNWRDLAPDAQQRQLTAWLKDDQARGFDLHQVPLMRLTLFRLADDTWRCVWSFHHLLLDGWSLSLALKDVFAFYEAARQGQDLRLPPSRPYRDYIAWLHAQDPAEAEAFWRETLRGFTMPTPLYVQQTIEADPAADDYTDQHLRLPVETTSALHAFARQQRVTLNTVIQGAWAALLSRYSSEPDVVFGATIAGRPAALDKVETMIGLFINTLPVRIHVPDDGALGPWLQTLQAQQAAARRYEYAPLVDIQRWSDVPQGQSLFDTLFVFENYPGEADVQPADPRLSIADMVTLEKTNYPLTVIVEPGETLRLRISYRRQRFADDTITRMLGHLHTLVDGMLTAPESAPGDLPLLTPAEREQILVAWNDTRTDYPRETPVHRLFEAQAAQTPGAVALSFEGATLTYAELNRQANRLARHLRELGVGPEIGVGVYVERSFEMIVGVLGILKAGGAYVPLDPTYPQERLAFMIDDTQAPVILTHTRLVGKLPVYGGRIVNLDDDPGTNNTDDNLDGGATADSLAYVIYTSGSTGAPKGTSIDHRAIMRLVKNTNFASLTADETFLQLATLSFDASTLEIWGSLLNGGKLVIFPAHKPSLDELARFIEEQRITTLWLTAGLFHQMVESYPESLCHVRQLLAGGDVLSVAHVRQMLDRLQPGHTLINGYGPTENTTFTCCYPMHSTAALACAGSQSSTVPIGRPIANTQVYILDRAMRPVPVGVPGELYIGGDGLARGYWRLPELTAERFVPHPFSAEPGARLYKTGDRARYLPTGDVEFMGRLDNQVKIRGYRVEPGEIEAHLEQHPAVQNAVVVAREDSPGDKRLVAYVIASPGQQSSADALREALQTALPDYMIPAAFVQLNVLPLTPNGKVDRAKLPTPDWTQAAVTHTPPRTPTEEALAEIWQSVLGVPQVGVHDNFFALGGHSLLATRVMSRVQQSFQIAIPLRAIFEAPTVAGLATVVEEALIREIEVLSDADIHAQAGDDD
jgi:amino acid adenylation domain-containing protein